MDGNGMKVGQIHIENIGGIKLVDITPPDGLVEISGPEAAGKTTLCETLVGILNGGGLPLRNGEEKGKAEVVLHDEDGNPTFTLTQQVRKGQSDRWMAVSADGGKYTSREKFIQAHIGPLAINPMAPSRMKPRDFIDLLFGLCPGLKDKLEEADATIEGIKASRSDILKVGKRLAVALEAAPYHEEAPEEAVSVVDLTNELNEAMEHNKARTILEDNIEASEHVRAGHENDLQGLKDKLALLQEQAKSLEEEIATKKYVCTQAYETICEKRDALKVTEPIDTTEITQRIADSEAVNAKVRENQDHARIQAERDATANEYSARGAELKKAEKDRALLLESAPLPVSGLGVNGAEATLNDVPISSLCTNEKLDLGCAILAAQDSKAKFAIIDDASLMGQKTKRRILESFPEMQFFLILNEESGDVGFFIEEGELKETTEKAEE